MLVYFENFKTDNNLEKKHNPKIGYCDATDESFTVTSRQKHAQQNKYL